MDSYQKSYQLVKKTPVDLCVTVNMPHGHPQGWAPKEIGLFVDHILTTGPALPRFDTPIVEGTRVFAEINNNRSPRSAKLHYTTDRGPWQTRKWTTEDAKVDLLRVTGDLPETRPIVAFFTVEDDRGAVSSSAHISRDKK
jgi:hypothetical protein